MKPPPPGPDSGLSVTQETKAAATQASTAFPPASSTRAPASAVSGCPAAIAPPIRESLLRRSNPTIQAGRCTSDKESGMRGTLAHLRNMLDRRAIVVAGLLT